MTSRTRSLATNCESPAPFSARASFRADPGVRGASALPSLERPAHDLGRESPSCDGVVLSGPGFEATQRGWLMGVSLEMLVLEPLADRSEPLGIGDRLSRTVAQKPQDGRRSRCRRVHRPRPTAGTRRGRTPGVAPERQTTRSLSSSSGRRPPCRDAHAREGQPRDRSANATPRQERRGAARRGRSDLGEGERDPRLKGLTPRSGDDRRSFSPRAGPIQMWVGCTCDRMQRSRRRFAPCPAGLVRPRRAQRCRGLS